MNELPEFDDFQVFVKPVGASCNLHCTYCYYLKNQDYSKTNRPPLMEEELLEQYIIQHIEASGSKTTLFSWHGGEPTLAGIDFYNRVIKFQKKHKPENKKIINGLITNGVNLNDKWCDFFANEDFIIGVSFDGPEELHNMHRVNSKHIGSFQDCIRGLNMLMKYRVNVEILCVVNSTNVKHPLPIYSFFKSLGVKNITFLPLVEKDLQSSTLVSQDSVPSEEFGDFMISIFDEWAENDIGIIKVQLFEETLRVAFHQEHSLCILKRRCGVIPALESNGDLFTCDHYVNPENLLGNITNTRLSLLLGSSRLKEFGDNKLNSLPTYCLSCEVLEMCNGECPKNRFIAAPTGEPGLNYLCKGYKKFFKHCSPFIEALRALK